MRSQAQRILEESEAQRAQAEAEFEIQLAARREEAERQEAERLSAAQAATQKLVSEGRAARVHGRAAGGQGQCPGRADPARRRLAHQAAGQQRQEERRPDRQPGQEPGRPPAGRDQVRGRALPGRGPASGRRPHPPEGQHQQPPGPAASAARRRCPRHGSPGRRFVGAVGSGPGRPSVRTCRRLRPRRRPSRPTAMRRRPRRRRSGRLRSRTSRLATAPPAGPSRAPTARPRTTKTGGPSKHRASALVRLKGRAPRGPALHRSCAVFRAGVSAPGRAVSGGWSRDGGSAVAASRSDASGAAGRRRAPRRARPPRARSRG